MKIAIVGSGISGLVSAYLLHGEHEVTVLRRTTTSAVTRTPIRWS